MNTNLDPVNVAVVVLMGWLGNELAAIIGPYAVILVASTVGAAWALGRRDPSAKFGATAYFLRLNVTAALVTVSLANLFGMWLGHEDVTWMLAPIALVVGGIGDDWPRLMAWIGRRAMRLVERRLDSTKNPGGDV